MKLIRLPEVLARTGLSRSTLWRLEIAGVFPKRRTLAGGRAVGWLEQEVDGYIASRPAARHAASRSNLC